MDFKNVFFKVKPANLAFSSFKDKLRKQWPQAVFNSRAVTSSITSVDVFANSAAYRGYQKDDSKYLDKHFTVTISDVGLVVFLPVRNARIENHIWNIKAEVEKQYPTFD